MSITPQLKKARETQGRSVKDVADAAGLHENTLRSAEASGSASERTLIPWAAALGYSLVLIPQDGEISSASRAS